MVSAGSKLLLLGLRSSGKTSYLAALWHLVEAGEVPASLRTGVLQPDREYLNRIRDSWLSFKEIGRTPLQGEQTVSLVLHDTQTGRPIEIVLPDLSGESFRLQWTMRKATRHYAAFARECAGVLLFIHPTAVKKAQLISTETKIASSSPAEEGKPWTPDQTPTQVQLVELLQFITWLRPVDAPLRIAVIVSAWDLIRDPILPANLVGGRLPLMEQFLTANAEKYPFRVYGVSALGGDLNQDRALLMKEAVPAKRIRVVEQRLDHHNDLTAPLRFLLCLDGQKDRNTSQLG